MKKIRVGNRLLGEGEPTFIVAEIGVNHNGRVDVAKKLIDAAKDAGADAVKFQVFKTESVVTEYAEKARYQRETTNTKKSQYEMLKKLELKDKDVRELYYYAKKRNIIFLSSAFDEESVDLLDSLGVPVFKIASGEITNFPLLEHVAKKKKPLALSTGMSTFDEIKDALKIVRKNGAKDIVLLHCITSYPAGKEEANLKVIQTLKQRFHLPVGFSDHTPGITIPGAAVALGAVLIEKHFTLDKKMLGPDHKASLEPNEMKRMIRGIREVEKALGDGVRKLTGNEEELKLVARRSIVAKVDISKGSTIDRNLLAVKRPGTGIPSKCMGMIVGKKARKDIKKDDILNWDMLE